MRTPPLFSLLAALVASVLLVLVLVGFVLAGVDALTSYLADLEELQRIGGWL